MTVQPDTYEISTDTYYAWFALYGMYVNGNPWGSWTVPVYSSTDVCFAFS